jgi:hypothetical protein
VVECTEGGQNRTVIRNLDISEMFVRSLILGRFANVNGFVRVIIPVHKSRKFVSLERGVVGFFFSKDWVEVLF